MKQLAEEVGRTVRAAITGWPETIRLCVLLAVAAASVTLFRTLS